MKKLSSIETTNKYEKGNYSISVTEGKSFNIMLMHRKTYSTDFMHFHDKEDFSKCVDFLIEVREELL